MQKIFKNYIFNLSYQILVIFLPIITTPYVSRVLAPEGIGAYNYSYSVVSLVITFAQLGTTLYGQREIAFVQNDSNKRSLVFAEIFLIRLIATLLAIPIYFLIIDCNDSYSAILMYMFIYIIANIFDISWFYQGLEEFKVTAIRNIAVKLSGVFLVFAFIHNKDDLNLYVIILALSQLVGNISIWSNLKKYIDFQCFKSICLVKHLKPILALFLPTAAMYVYVYIDKIILGIFSSDVQVGYYSQSEKIVRLLLTIITSLGAVLLPHISSAIRNDRRDLVINDVHMAISYVIHIGFPIVVGACVIAERFIPIFLGEEFLECISLFKMMSVLIIVIGMASVVGQSVLIPMKKQKMYSISILCGAITNIALDLILIPFLGAMGAAIGTIIAETTVTCIQVYCVNKILNLKVLSCFLKSYKCIMASFIMGFIGIILDHLIQEGVIGIIVIICICTFLYFFLLFIFKDTEFRIFYAKFRSRLQQTHF